MQATRRTAPRRPCRGTVIVHRLAGGPSFCGTLIDVAGGGIRVALDRRLAEGEAVRLVFRRNTGEPGGSGWTMLGSVVHSSNESGREVAGIAFGWSAAVGTKAVRLDRKPASTSWFRSLLRKVGRRGPASVHGR